MDGNKLKLPGMRLTIALFLAFAVFASVSRAQAPVFEISHADSSIKFKVNASVAIAGTFDKWEASLKFTSPKLASAVLDIKIDAASVNTGSGMKDGKLKGKDFFAVKENPLITFHSTKVEQTGPDTLEFDGDFTIRGVTKAEKLAFTITGKGTGTGSITGTMAFDRKRYGMKDGRRPVYGGTEKFQSDPHWKDLISFYEYFHADNGAGIGASHQTGWTGLVARIFELAYMDKVRVLGQRPLARRDYTAVTREAMSSNG